MMAVTLSSSRDRLRALPSRLGFVFICLSG
jgi:hypothetical protein